jgi:hypothetical protein
MGQVNAGRSRLEKKWGRDFLPFGGNQESFHGADVPIQNHAQGKLGNLTRAGSSSTNRTFSDMGFNL